MRLVLLLVMMLVLAACGGNAAEDFTDLESVPDYLRAENAFVGITNEGLSENPVLRMIVSTEGRDQMGRLFIEPDGSATQENIVLEARVRLSNNGRVTFWIRSGENGCSGYGLVLDPTRDNYRLATIRDNCDVENLETRSRLNVDLDRWYTMRIEANGSTIRGFVDTVEFFTIEDETYSSGTIFIEVINDGALPAQLEIDDLLMR